MHFLECCHSGITIMYGDLVVIFPAVTYIYSCVRVDTTLTFAIVQS